MYLPNPTSKEKKTRRWHKQKDDTREVIEPRCSIVAEDRLKFAKIQRDPVTCSLLPELVQRFKVRMGSLRSIQFEVGINEL